MLSVWQVWPGASFLAICRPIYAVVAACVFAWLWPGMPQPY